MKDFRIHCPVCENGNIQILRHFSFIVPQGHPISDGYNLVICEKCGFVYANISAEQEDYDNYYQKVSKYEDSKTSTGSGESLWENERFANTVSILSPYLRNINAKILDIGCANGGQLLALRNQNFTNLFGLDPSESCAELCRQKGLTVSQGTLAINSLGEKSFDCVIFSHVLEHIVDVHKAVNNISNLVQDNGFLYIEVPDANRYKDYLFSPFQDINTEHINHFSLKILTTLFSGWELVVSNEKEILSSPGKPYPAVYCLFRKKTDIRPSSVIIKDQLLPKNIKEYLDRSEELLSSINHLLQKKLVTKFVGNTEFIVWGTGQLTMKLLTETCLRDFNIIGFVDGNPINQGRFFANRLIISPVEVKKLPSSVPIIISTILHYNEIIEVINNLEIPNPIITLD